MRDFTSLSSAMQRNTLLALVTCTAMLAMTVASLVYAFAVAGNARALEQHLPVLVVPGAVGGIYSPGITEEHIRATARYLASLATNFSAGRSFRDRFDELESFSSPQFLPGLQRARGLLQRDVDTQNQSRSFFAASSSEQLHEAGAGQFDYRVQGERVVYASGLAMDSHRCEIHLRLRWGAPSRTNRAGIVLEGFDVRDIASTGTAGAPANAS